MLFIIIAYDAARNIALPYDYMALCYGAEFVNNVLVITNCITADLVFISYCRVTSSTLEIDSSKLYHLFKNKRVI